MPSYLCTLKYESGDTEELLIVAASKQAVANHLRNNFTYKSIEEIKDYPEQEQPCAQSEESRNTYSTN